MSQIDIFKKNLNKTASYIYSRDANGVFLFALCRKVPFGSRKRITGGSLPNTGAAGTKKKYCGKWGSIGGGISKNSHHLLDAAVKEIVDEAGIQNLDSRYHVDISWSRNRKIGAYLKLDYARNINGVAIFIFEMTDYTTFNNWFPKFPQKRGGADIVTSSKGEIDFLASFSTDSLKDLQKSEIRNKNNNFMISYASNTFSNVVIPFISGISQTYQSKHLNNRLEFINDTNERIVNPMPNYQEMQGGRYT